jgi:hypothetical protein
MHLQVVDFLIDLSLQLSGFFVLDLAILEHLVNVMILVHEQVILSPSVLNGLTNLWKGIFYVSMHVSFCPMDIFL